MWFQETDDSNKENDSTPTSAARRGVSGAQHHERTDARQGTVTTAAAAERTTISHGSSQLDSHGGCRRRRVSRRRSMSTPCSRNYEHAHTHYKLLTQFAAAEKPAKMTDDNDATSRVCEQETSPECLTSGSVVALGRRNSLPLSARLLRDNQPHSADARNKIAKTQASTTMYNPSDHVIINENYHRSLKQKKNGGHKMAPPYMRISRRGSLPLLTLPESSLRDRLDILQESPPAWDNLQRICGFEAESITTSDDDRRNEESDDVMSDEENVYNLHMYSKLRRCSAPVARQQQQQHCKQTAATQLLLNQQKAAACMGDNGNSKRKTRDLLYLSFLSRRNSLPLKLKDLKVCEKLLKTASSLGLSRAALTYNKHLLTTALLCTAEN